MADQEQLAILKQGVTAWNDWRKRNPNIRPDLRGLEFSKANLHGANLMQADLYTAWLDGANLCDADLREANLMQADLDWAALIEANLYKAELVRAELTGAKLMRANLNEANLKQADLTLANLSDANLGGANLNEAQLNGADLTDADLRGTDLNGADLTSADLSGARLLQANLSGANLRGAYLVTADLTGADLRRAIAADTIFADIDLSQVKGLDEIEHRGPSTIGAETIYKARGKIPEAFLRGCGLPEDFITFVDSFNTGKTIPIYSAFIRYSDKDKLFARRLHADLQANKVRVWLAPGDLIGDRFWAEVGRVLRVYDKLMVVLSGTSVASDWVVKQVEAAFEKERNEKRTVLFPVRVDETVMETSQAWAADIRRTRHIGDFTQWDNPIAYQDNINRLLGDLQAVDTKSPAND